MATGRIPGLLPGNIKTSSPGDEFEVELGTGTHWGRAGEGLRGTTVVPFLM